MPGLLTRTHTQGRRVRWIAASLGWFFPWFVLVLIFPASAHSSALFRIGVSLGLTGQYADLARMQERAYKLWEAQVNRRGGIRGRTVEVQIVDDRSNADRARQLYRTLILEKRVDMVFGPYSSNVTAAVVPIVEEFNYPMLAAGGAADDIWWKGFRNVFGMWTPASRYAVGILSIALLGDLDRVAIVSAGDEFSEAVANGARRWARALGLDVVMSRRLEEGGMDAATLAEKARDAHASILLVAGHFKEALALRRALDAIDWYPDAYYATVGPALEKYYDVLGALAEHSFSTSIWEPHEVLNFPRSKEFATAFEKRYGERPSYHAATAYAAGQILEAAITLADSMERGPIRDALYSLDTYSIIGRYAVDGTGMQVKRFPLTVQWLNGKKEIVWPESVRSSTPVFGK